MVLDDLPKFRANFTALTPLSFLPRTASLYPDKESVIYRDRVFTWRQTFARCRRLASALRSLVSQGDTVAVIAPNVPAMYEVHFGVPMAGAILNSVNIRLDARATATILTHAEAKLLLVDTEFLEAAHKAVEIMQTKPVMIHVEDKTHQRSRRAGKIAAGLLEYEELLSNGDPDFPIALPADEWNAISVNYTSGTTSQPKGVVYSHRATYLNCLSIAIDWGMPQFPVYLWTVPMFHCNGWLHPWIVTALAGTHICLRAVIPKIIFQAISEHRVTHFCAAPVVLHMLCFAKEDERRPFSHLVNVLTGGAPPPPSILATMETLGFRITHGYGMTESVGHAVSCVWKPEWDQLESDERARLKARQGVHHLGLLDADVIHPKTMNPVARDGKTVGEVMLRGNCLMKGYLKEKDLTEEAFRGGRFHTGDLAVMNPDNYISLKDRSKDIIISGGENISSIEVETILCQHQLIREAAVVSRPDDFWGETPCAFVTLKNPTLGNKETEADIIQFCRRNLPRYMTPKTVVFGDLPKTVTGKYRRMFLGSRPDKLDL